MNLAEQLLEQTAVDSPHSPQHYIQQVASQIDAQRGAVSRVFPLLSGGWFERFGAEAQIPGMIPQLRQAARFVMDGGRTYHTAMYLKAHDDPDAWTLRSMLRSVGEDRSGLHQFENLWRRLADGMRSPAYTGAVAAAGEGGQEVDKAVHAVIDAHTGRIMSLDSLFSRLGDGSHQQDHDPDHHHRTEVLYHVSVVAREIHHHGFLEPQADLIGFSSTYGNRPAYGVSDDDVSFTSDLAIAHEIARSLREVVGIANGDITPEDVREWIDEVEVDVFEPSAPPPTRTGTFQLYQSYLAATDRYNPVYLGDTTGMLDNLEGRRADDVGILQCSVRLDDDVDYLRSLREFRVPLDAVVSVDRLFM